MADQDQLRELNSAIQKLNETIQNWIEHEPSRKGTSSEVHDYLGSTVNQSKNLSEADKKFLNEQKENYEKSNKSFWNIFRNQRTWGGFFRSYIDRTQESLAKKAIKQRFPNASKKEIDAIYKEMPHQFKGGKLGGFFNVISKITKGFYGIIFALQILEDVLKATAEARKFYVPSIRQGYGFDRLGAMIDQSTKTLNYLRSPLTSGLFANNSGYKDAFSELMSAGVLNQTNIRDSEALVKSFRFVAAQGLILGETFSDTAKNIISAGSIYNLGFGGNIMEGYKYMNKFIERGIMSGFSKSAMTNLFLNYGKSAAVTNSGLITVFKDMKIMLQTMESVNKDRNQMPYYASIFQNLMSSRLSSLGTFAALVDEGSAYSVSGLGRLAQLYQGSSPLAQKTIAMRNLLKKSGMRISKENIALLTELSPEFSSFRDEKSVDVLYSLVKNASINRNFLQETQGLSAQDMAKWAIKNAGIGDRQRDSIEKVAQVTEAMTNPLQTIITITTGMLNVLYSIAGSPVLRLFASDIKVGPAQKFIENGSTRTSTVLNKNYEARQRS